jgi:hypothetical protein
VDGVELGSRPLGTETYWNTDLYNANRRARSTRKTLTEEQAVACMYPYLGFKQVRVFRCILSSHLTKGDEGPLGLSGRHPIGGIRNGVRGQFRCGGSEAQYLSTEGP